MPTLPYGSWPSPVTAGMLVTGGVSPLEVHAEDGVTWFSQSRPAENGRTAVVRRDADATTTEVLPAGVGARTRVHEYGGGAWWVHGGVVFLAAWDDQRLHRVEPGGTPVPITPEPPERHGFRFADGALTPDGATVVAVREDHTGPGEARNEVVAVPAAGGEVTVLAGGSDFVAAPRVSPDGRTVVWLAWDHPNMPWDDVRLMTGRLAAPDAPLEDVRALVDRPGTSLVQPGWTPDGRLLVVSDSRDGWWNLHEVDPATGALTPLHADDAEVCGPAWALGQSRWAAGPDGTVWLTFSDGDGAALRRVGPDGSTDLVRVPAVALESLRVDGDRLLCVATHVDQGAEVIEVPCGAGALGAPRCLSRAEGEPLPPASVSRPRHVTFPSAGGRTAHAWFYPPAGDGLRAPDGERPPLLVMVHGGPTASASPAYRLSTQYWTTRGFAVVDVDYGGSTGYGRPYRRLLDGAWGVVDIEDVEAAVRHLAGTGLVDPRRVAIRGGSAGGFTTLLALATTDVFAAGTSMFGVADLAALAADTHKFESRYLDGLVGPLPEAADVYRDRSPLTHAHRIAAPLLVLQGLEDEVVPPAQSEAIVAAVRANGVPHAYIAFPGEQHGFRVAENIVTALESELAFYGRVLGFTPAGDVRDVDLVLGDRRSGHTGGARP